MRSEHDGKTHAERAALGTTAGDLARVGQSVTLADSEAVDGRPRIEESLDAFRLLAWAAAFDGRERGDGEAFAWLEILRGLVIEDVKTAITEHYRNSRFPVMPADVIQIIEEGGTP